MLHRPFLRSFQSTLPIRGATILTPFSKNSASLSIHAPHTGSDGSSGSYVCALRFQSTLPIRGATYRWGKPNHIRAISIHAPHTGSDRTCPDKNHMLPYFNPRSPYGERHLTQKVLSQLSPFQSTLPIRGATAAVAMAAKALAEFQSTLPIRGATQRYL